MERSMIDAASGGALVDKTPVAAKSLIENMATNSQQFSTRSNSVVTRGVHEMHVTHDADQKKLENRLDELTFLVKQMTVSQQPPPPLSSIRVCGICTSVEHPTDACPTLQEDENHATPQAYAANIYNNRPQ